MDAHEITLWAALREIARRPFAALIVAWNWKTAAVSALLRAAIFFATNLRAGGHSAMRASVAETAFAIAAAGLMGAVTQRLRNARPVWATAVTVWLGLPALMVAAQFAWHRALGTPHLKAGLIASFCFASIASGFNWFAMRRGAMLAGAGVTGDVRALPGIVVEFVLAAPKALGRVRR